jgi:hypothetical protein
MSASISRIKPLMGYEIASALFSCVMIKSANTLPHSVDPDREQLIVCNTAPDYDPGEHWVAIYLDGDGMAEFFDSTGSHPSFYGFDRFMDANSVSWVYNAMRIQHPTSNACGHHVIVYGLSKMENINLSEYINTFSSNDLALNDYTVVNFVRDLHLCSY